METGREGRFPRAVRLKKSEDFARIYRYGQKQAGKYFVLHVLPCEGGTRMGIVLSRRWGSAVERNRVKRLVRETFRLHRRDFDGLQVVIRPREACKGRSFSQIERALVTELRAGRVKESIDGEGSHRSDEGGARPHPAGA